MSKTYFDKMTKARVLIDGLKQNAEWASSHNIRQDELEQILKVIEEGEKMSAEVDALREKASEITAAANAKLLEVKEKAQAWKREVKQNVDMTQWINFGVQDKR